MLASVLSLILLVGAASAGCPLRIAVWNTTGHILNIAITNKGNETVHVFKGNTMFSGHDTHWQGLHVTDVDNHAIPFEGIFIHYKTTDLPPDMFQTFAPGETVIAPINVAKAFKLARVPRAKVSLVQPFQLTAGPESATPTSIKPLENAALCTMLSGEVEIQVDQTTAALDLFVLSGHSDDTTREFHSRENNNTSPAFVYQGCTGEQVTSLQTTFQNASTMASYASLNARNGSHNLFNQWFRKAGYDKAQHDFVAQLYDNVTKLRNQRPEVVCGRPPPGLSKGNHCGPNAYAWATVRGNMVGFCNAYWDLPQGPCDDRNGNRAFGMLHELTHLLGTWDHAYGRAWCQNLPDDGRAENNADTYALYASELWANSDCGRL